MRNVNATGEKLAGLKNDGWLVRSKVKQMCYVLLGLSMFVLKYDSFFFLWLFHSTFTCNWNRRAFNANFETRDSRNGFSCTQFRFSTVMHCGYLWTGRDFYRRSSVWECGAAESLEKLFCVPTYRDKLSNPRFFECSVRCMWRRHSTVTDCYNYVFASDPTAVIGRHIDILSIDSMHSSHRSLQKKKRRKMTTS